MIEVVKKYALGVLTTLTTTGIIVLVSSNIKQSQELVLIKYQMNQVHAVLQDLSERIEK